MSEYIVKVEDEVGKELMCECKRRKVEEYEEFQHKINFLR
jgi:hypothetical protein